MHRNLSSQRIKNREGARTNTSDVGSLRLRDERKLVHQKPLFWCSVIFECQKQTSEMKFSSTLSIICERCSCCTVGSGGRRQYTGNEDLLVTVRLSFSLRISPRPKGLKPTRKPVASCDHSTRRQK